jgi:large subunit ribosomal protein L13
VMKTYVAKGEERDARWYVVDAEGQILGRLASEVAAVLRGKHKPEYSPFQDQGDFVIVINADKVRVTGNKETKKFYRRHTGYPGGLKEVRYDKVMEKHPTRIVETAVRGMLPKNSLGRKLFRKLKVYAGPTHPHAAQQPDVLEIKG